MPFLSFPEYRPDVDDYRGQHTTVLSGVLPRGDGWGPIPAAQVYAPPLLSGNDAFTKVLLHMDGTTSTFTDSNAGGAAKTWTASGGGTQDGGQSKFGGKSYLGDGSGDWISTPDHADFMFGSSDWTIDFWFRLNSPADNLFQGLAAKTSGSGGAAANTEWYFARNSANQLVFTASNGTANSQVTTSATYTTSLNTGWHHLAGVRSGGTLYFFVDGVLVGTAAISGSINNLSVDCFVGGMGAGNSLNGWIDEFRVSVGTARWTAAFIPPKAAYDTAANGVCRGFTYARATDGTITVFAGTIRRLLKLDNASLLWEDVSKGASAYSDLASTDQWQFAQFGSVVVAVQANVPPQAFTLGGSTAFADLAGSPPSARYVAVVGRFLVLSGLTGAALRVKWSDLDNITNWTTGSGFSNHYDLPDGGVVRGVAGGEFGIILQESTIRRLGYVPGQKPAFQLERISEEQGLIGPYSIARAGGRVLFLSQQGFQEYAPGVGLTPIGKEKVDRTFLADLDKANLQLFIGAADPAGTRVFWAYKSIAGGASTAFDKIICYDVILQRWSPPIAVSGQYLTPVVKPGLTLDSPGFSSSSIETLSFSLDSVQASLESRLAVFDTAAQLCFFEGQNQQAVLETPEQDLGEGRRMLVRGFRVRTDAGAVFGSTKHRRSPQATLAQTAESAINQNGFVPTRVDTALARHRVRIPTGTSWTYCMGVEPDLEPTGQQ